MRAPFVQSGSRHLGAVSKGLALRAALRRRRAAPPRGEGADVRASPSRGEQASRPAAAAARSSRREAAAPALLSSATLPRATRTSARTHTPRCAPLLPRSARPAPAAPRSVRRALTPRLPAFAARRRAVLAARGRSARSHRAGLRDGGGAVRRRAPPRRSRARVRGGRIRARPPPLAHPARRPRHRLPHRIHRCGSVVSMRRMRGSIQAGVSCLRL